MFNFRFILGFAALAVVISLLAGLLGGISFGLILLRTLIGAAAFALLGAGAWWVLQKFVPELLETEAKREHEPARATGDEVDIVIPEENPHRPTEGSEFISTGEAFQPSVSETGSADGGEDEVSELEIEPEIAGAFSEGGTADASSEPDGEPDFSEAALGGEPSSSAAAADSNEVAAQPAVEDADEGFADLDSMPSLDSLEGSFAQSETEQDAPQPGATIDVMGQQQDAETTAKAIQTWLKRDEKG
jgi:hypothetical protein